MIAPRLAALALLSISGRAFQVAPSLRAAPSRVLIPRSPTSTIALKMPASRASSLRRNALPLQSDDEDASIETHPVELVKEDATDGNALAKFASRIKDIAQTQPGSLLLSLAIFLLPLFMISAFPESAWAAGSGGRMGGSFGGSARSSSSRGYSAPSGSYSSGYSRGYSSGYYSRPNVIVSPGISPFYSPFYSPFSPFYARPSGVVVSTGPSFGGLFFFAGFFLFAALVLSNIGNSVGDSFSSALASDSVLGSGVSVAEISVALEVPDRDSPNSILSALDRLSRTARTDSRVGLQNLTSQVAIELLRRKSSIVAANTKASHYRDENKALRDYNNISVKERGKFDRETVSRFGGVDYSGARAQSKQSEYNKATVAVVTIVMLIDGDSTSKQLSGRVNSVRDVEDALSRIAADAKADECLRGAEILWTPEERDETLTMRDVLADYPSLRSV